MKGFQMLIKSRRQDDPIGFYDDGFYPNEQQIRSSVRRAEKRYKRKSYWPVVLFPLGIVGLILFYLFS